MDEESFPDHIDIESEEELTSLAQATSKKKCSTSKTVKPSVMSGKDFKRQRKLTSGVWVNYDFIDPDEEGNLLCKCKKCGKVYKADSKMGTGNLIRHVKNCKRRNFKDVGQLILESSTSGSLASRSFNVNPDVFREMLAVAIVKHDLPFQFAEYDGIRRCFNYLNPDLKVVSRNTLKSDVLKMFKKEKLKLAKELSLVPSRISLTSDCWTSITTDGYISLTAHYIDKDWCLQKKILNFCFMPPPHTGVNLSAGVYEMLKDWGIQKKIFSITLDNASSNDILADLLKGELDLICSGNYFHVRCCAHILNLIVHDGLKEIDESIYKVRESVKYCKGSQARRQKFLLCVAHVELDSRKGLRQDVPTRWNSTYLMLESAIYYKKAFIHFQKTDANYIHCPTTDEWFRIEKMFKFLKVFYEVTLAFSGTKFPTANLYFPNILRIRLLLQEEKGNNDSFMKIMACRMFEKFSKYWSDFSIIMAVAALLDPRFKYQFVEWGCQKVYGEQNCWDELASLKEKLSSLYNSYAARFSPSSSSTGLQGGANGQNQQAGGVFDASTDSFMMDFDSYSTGKSVGTSKSDLDMYLEEPLLPRMSNLNVLDFWKTNEIRFPVLAQMARDILAIPISTVASESAFSTGGRVLDAFRSSLKPSTVEAIICLRDWTFGEGKMDPQMDELFGEVMKLKVDDDSTPLGSPQCVDASTQGSSHA